MSLTDIELTRLGRVFARELLDGLAGEITPEGLAIIATNPDYYDILIDETEAAAFISVKVATMRSWRHLGGGPRFCRPSGRMVRYCRRDLIAWRDKNTVASTSEPIGGLEA